MFHVKHDAEPEGIEAHLQHALADLQLPEAALDQMAAHWRLVVQWNARTNLTAVHSAREATLVHYRDSLAGLPLLHDGPVVDFGSGAGYPGLVLAMARPAWRFTLVEPRRKRVSFLEAAIARLGMGNVRVLEGRMQDAPDTSYAHAVTRATFSRLEDLQAIAPWLRAGGTLLAYRGSSDSTAAASHAYQLADKTRTIDIWRF